MDIPAELHLDDPERIGSEADRLVDGLLRYGDEVSDLCEVHPLFPVPLRTGVVGASYDVAVRLAPALDDTVMTVQLPQARAEDGGRVARIVRVNAVGTIVIRALGRALINGYGAIKMHVSPGMAEIRCDGVNFYTSYAGAAWDEDPAS
jgi:hypothetical protein